MSKSKSTKKNTPHCKRCPELPVAGRTCCAKHIAEKNAELRARFTPPAAQIRTFAVDWRTKNSAMHNSCVRDAYEDLQIAQEAARTLEERARVPCSVMAGALRRAMREEIERSAAFFEAAALLFAGIELPPAPLEEA